jgi:trimethylamine--corrinoid protein Co-methyltransferase
LDEHWVPRLIDRSRFETWTEHGAKDLTKRAREKALTILKEHRPEPLPRDILDGLTKIVHEAEKLAPLPASS